MDRPCSSKVRKSQRYPNDKIEGSGEARISGQPKKRPVSSFAGNVFKKKEGATKLVPGVTEANEHYTCGGVNPPTNIGVPSAATDHSERRHTGLIINNNKHLLPTIKAPIYPSSLLQHRITSCLVRRKPLSETLESHESLSLNLPVRAPPVPEKLKDTRPSVTKCSSTTKDDTKKQPSQKKSVQQPAITTTVKKNTQKNKKVIIQETLSPQENASTITANTTPFDQPHSTNDNVSPCIVSLNAESTLHTSIV